MGSIGAYLLEASERLSSSNYSAWKVRMESLLVLNDLMDIVSSDEERPLVKSFHTCGGSPKCVKDLPKGLYDCTKYCLIASRDQ